MKTWALPTGRLEIGWMPGARPPALVAAAALLLGGRVTIGIGRPEPVTVPIWNPVRRRRRTARRVSR